LKYFPAFAASASGKAIADFPWFDFREIDDGSISITDMLQIASTIRALLCVNGHFREMIRFDALNLGASVSRARRDPHVPRIRRPFSFDSLRNFFS